MKKIIILIITLILVGCTKNDELYISDEDMLRDGSYAFIVQITGVSETIQEYYLDNQVPKTIFNATCIYALYGECDEIIKISRKGGYDYNNNFIGVIYEETGVLEYVRIGDEDLEHNLFEISEYYLVIVEHDSNDYITRRYFPLIDYDINLDAISQIGDSGLKISYFIKDIEIMEENELD